MVSLVNSHTNATSKKWHLWKNDLRFALNSTLGWHRIVASAPSWGVAPRPTSPSEEGGGRRESPASEEGGGGRREADESCDACTSCTCMRVRV